MLVSVTSAHVDKHDILSNMLWIFTNIFPFQRAWNIRPLPVMVWIGAYPYYYHTILVTVVIVRLVTSPVFVPIQIQWSSVRPLPVIFIVRVRKPNPVIFLFVGRQKFRFYEIIFFTRCNLYQTGMPFFAFLLRVFPSFRRRKQFITRLAVANPPLLTSWVKKQ